MRVFFSSSSKYHSNTMLTSNNKIIAYPQTAGQDRLTCEAEEYDSVYFNEVCSSL